MNNKNSTKRAKIIRVYSSGFGWLGFHRIVYFEIPTDISLSNGITKGCFLKTFSNHHGSVDNWDIVDLGITSNGKRKVGLLVPKGWWYIERYRKGNPQKWRGNWRLSGKTKANSFYLDCKY